MVYENENCKAEAVPYESEIVKQISLCLEEVERLHSNISDLKHKLSPISRLEETTPATPKTVSLATTKVGDIIQSLAGRIDLASRKVADLYNLVEV